MWVNPVKITCFVSDQHCCVEGANDAFRSQAQMHSIEIFVALSNPQGLWLYLSYANPIIMQWEEREENRDRIVNAKFGVRQRTRRKIARKINNNLNAKKWNNKQEENKDN